MGSSPTLSAIIGIYVNLVDGTVWGGEASGSSPDIPTSFSICVMDKAHFWPSSSVG